MTLTPEEAQQWFKTAAIKHPRLDCGLWEELYQAFKARMLAEIRKEGDDDGILVNA